MGEQIAISTAAAPVRSLRTRRKFRAGRKDMMHSRIWVFGNLATSAIEAHGFASQSRDWFAIIEALENSSSPHVSKTYVTKWGEAFAGAKKQFAYRVSARTLCERMTEGADGADRWG